MKQATATNPCTYLAYSVLALVILLPLLKPGFILTLDMVFTPHLRLPPSGVSSSYLFYALLHILNLIIPSEIIEKTLLFLILFLSGLGTHRLADYLYSNKPNIYHKISAYSAGIFYTINPFTYDRFMAGQYVVLLGYALLPWFTRTMLKFLQGPSWPQTLKLAAWTLVISIISIHTLGLMALIGIIALAGSAWQHRRDKSWLRDVGKGLVTIMIIFVAASSYWLVPLAAGKGSTADTITSFTAGDRQAFATIGGNAASQIVHIARLQGFWEEARAMYILPQQQVHAWGLLTFLIWILLFVGVVSLWRGKQRYNLYVFWTTSIIAALLAIGLANNWLAAHLPLFAGYREPEKFVALVALAFAALSAHGVAAILKYCHARAGKGGLIILSIVLLLMPIIWTRPMLWGFSGQLQPVHYPDDWQIINQRLNGDSTAFQTLFLPWHLYMAYGFTGRIIASPAPKFFDKPIVTSNNPEFNGAAPTPNAEASHVTPILATARGHRDLGARLAPYHIKYILLAHEDDYRAYTYLDHQIDLKLITKSATLDLYRNEAWQ